MITLFTTQCPRCRVLETKLNDAGIDFNIQTDVQEIIDAGFVCAPILKVDNIYYDFKQAIDWLKEQ